jgi:mRNA interferase MazF
MKMNKGDIFWAKLDPAEGQEQGGTRPVVIVSGDLMNQNFQLVWVIPVTSHVKNFFGGLVIVPSPENGLLVTSEALPFQVRSVAKSRLLKKLGKLSAQDVRKIQVTIHDILRM